MVQTSEGRRWLDRAAAGIRSRPDREAVRAELGGPPGGQDGGPGPHLPGPGAAGGGAGRRWSRWGTRRRSERSWPGSTGPGRGTCGRPAGCCSRRASCGCWPSVCSGGMTPIWGTTTAPEWWDMDGLPGTAVMGDCDDIRYLPGGDPDQILTLEPCLTASVNGQKISLLRAALWQREDGRQGLYCYLRVDTWRFWERGRLREEWMTVTDSTGAVCGLGPDSPEDPETGGLLNGMSQMGFGPFHSGYELYLEDWDPEAEWVRLDYGPGSPIFHFYCGLGGGEGVKGRGGRCGSAAPAGAQGKGCPEPAAGPGAGRPGVGAVRLSHAHSGDGVPAAGGAVSAAPERDRISERLLEYRRYRECGEPGWDLSECVRSVCGGCCPESGLFCHLGPARAAGPGGLSPGGGAGSGPDQRCDCLGPGARKDADERLQPPVSPDPRGDGPGGAGCGHRASGGERFLRRAQEGFCLEDGVWLFPLESPEGAYSGDWYEGRRTPSACTGRTGRCSWGRAARCGSPERRRGPGDRVSGGPPAGSGGPPWQDAQRGRRKKPGKLAEHRRKIFKTPLTHTGVLLYDSKAPVRAQSAMMREIARKRGNFRGVCPRIGRLRGSVSRRISPGRG